MYLAKVKVLEQEKCIPRSGLKILFLNLSIRIKPRRPLAMILERKKQIAGYLYVGRKRFVANTIFR
jgi:hypothetical protein